MNNVGLYTKEDFDFYPTPDELVVEMIEGLKASEISTITAISTPQKIFRFF